MSLLSVATDGLLFKLKRIGKQISRRKAISGIKGIFEKDQLPKRIPLVSGEIDVVEIKADKGFIGADQKEAYRLIIEKGSI
jgi:Glu-tRNA(Gln) amidotransferase subunit E-like FAD-binding protein